MGIEQEEPFALLMTSRSSIQLEDELKEEIHSALENEDSYGEILKEIEENDNGIITRNGTKYKESGQLLLINKTNEDDQVYWKIVISNVDGIK